MFKTIFIFCCFAIALFSFYKAFLQPFLEERRQEAEQQRLDFEHATRSKFTTLFDEKNYKFSTSNLEPRQLCSIKHVPTGVYFYFRYIFALDVSNNWRKEIQCPEQVCRVMLLEEREVLREFLSELAEDYLDKCEEAEDKWAKEQFISKENT